MRTWAKGTARAAMLTASFVALGAGTAFPSGAFADTTSGDSSVLGGNQLNTPVSAPIDASGNAAAVLGSADAASRGGATVAGGSGGSGQRTSGDNGIGSGNQINAPISAPVNACGNAIAIFGTADAGCKGGAKVKNSGGRSGQRTSGNSGIGSGNQINAPISAPVNACGNAVAVFGSSEAGCEGGAKVLNGAGGQQTTGASGVIAGNQVNAPISAPINICGNAAAVLGEAVAGCEGGAKVKNGGHTGAGQKTSGKDSILGGNQAAAPISAPVDVCGNAVGGDAVADCDGGASVRNGGHGSGGQTTNGDGSILGGNQANAPVSVPVSACGNAVAVLGEAGSFCEGGAHVRSSSGGSQTTSGKDSIVGGNQINAPVSIPVNVCGNAVAVLGDAAASCDGSVVVKGSNGSGATTSGNSGIGSGNQANAPVSAPASVCGNAAAVAGHAEPQCGDGPSHGGYEPYWRTTSSRLPGPAAGKYLGLPTMPGITKSFPTGLTSALPMLPQLSGKTPALTGKPALPGTTPALPGQVEQLPTGRTAAADKLTGTSPAVPGVSKDVTKLPGVNAYGTETSRVPAKDVPGLDQVAGVLSTDVTKALRAGSMPALPGVPAKQLAKASTVPVKLPATTVNPSNARTVTPVPETELPGTGQLQLPGLGKLPATGGVKVPGVGGVTDLGAIKPMAAAEPMTTDTGSSIWVLATAAMLTAMSGAVALTRRVRLGGRR